MTINGEEGRGSVAVAKNSNAPLHCTAGEGDLDRNSERKTTSRQTAEERAFTEMQTNTWARLRDSTLARARDSRNLAHVFSCISVLPEGYEGLSNGIRTAIFLRIIFQ